MSTRRNRRRLAQVRLATLVLALLPAPHGFAITQTSTVKWSNALRQSARWYGSTEAIRIADNLLLFQRNSGGWPKNIDMAAVLGDGDRVSLLKEQTQTDSTIDNGATYTQLVFLARVYRAAKLNRHRESLIRGIDYLLAAQYDNGGWPQYFPLREGYYRHITFNDDAMIG